MAQRRMFSKQIVNTDAFLDMPMSAQLLYFHLNMEADDDGFVSSPKKIMKILGSSTDDFKILEAKRFILVFESGVIVIKHWLIHNYIRKDTYSATKYEQEKASLLIKDNGSYTECKRPVDDTLTQVRVGKVRVGKVRVGKVSLGERLTPPPSEIAKDFFNNEEKRRELGIALATKHNADIQLIASEIRKFTLYWTEPNKSGTRQRWETEKTFEVSRRLEKWFSNIKQFNKSNEKKGVSI